MHSENDTACAFCVEEESRHKEPDLHLLSMRTVLAAVMLSLGILMQLTLAGSLHYVLFLLSMGLAGRDIIPRGLRGAAKLHLDINFLMTSAAAGATLIGAPAEGAAVLLLFSIAELLEARANAEVKREIKSLVQMKSITVSVKNPDGETRVHPEHIPIGTIIAVRPGETIGLDGIVTEGMTQVDQSAITGESLPVTRTHNERVLAGSTNLEGYIEVRTTALASDTILSRIITLVEEAQKKKSRTESAVKRFAHVYTPVVVVASFVLASASFIFGFGLYESVYRGLTLLVTSCPCAFAISIPVSMVSTITGAARQGILVKGGRYIEQLSSTKTVALDKTGTLTQARLRVRDICTKQDESSVDILRIAASLETRSEHPIGRALVSEAAAQDLRLSDAEQFAYTSGRGIRGRIDGIDYEVGSDEVLETAYDKQHPISVPDCEGGTVVHVVREGIHVGTIVLSDTVRNESRELVRSLHNMGIKTVMLTGDKEDAAREVAQQVGITDFRSRLTPDEKVEHIKALSREGTCVMVGDGVNDAPALAAADVGIAMGAISSDLAIETADIALMTDDLLKIPPLIRRSRNTMDIVKQNVVASLLVKSAVAAMAVAGVSTLWLAIGVGDMGLTMAVVANALRLVKRH